MNEPPYQTTSDPQLIKKISQLREELKDLKGSIAVTMYNGLIYSGSVCGQQFGRGSSEKTGSAKRSWAGGFILVETPTGIMRLDALDIKSWVRS
jgi:hypothetical protein